MKKILSLFLYLPFIAVGQFNKQEREIDSLLTGFIKKANIPGLSVAVSLEGKIIYKGNFGFADIENKIPVTQNTQFRIGSVTKLFSAVAFVKMLEEGSMEENDPLKKYLEDLPAPYQSITLSQLASHTSGVRHYHRNEFVNRNTIEYTSLQNSFSRFINDTLLFEPGSKYSYSSYGYTLLGAAMEAHKKKKFNEILSEYIFTPTGMNHTQPEIIGSGVNNTRFYFRGQIQGEYTLAEGENSSYKWPAGGFISTATDLVQFGSNLIEGKIINKKMLPLLFSTQVTTPGKETGAGYGFRLGVDVDGQKVVHHGGVSEGARAFLLIYPEKKLVISLLANVFMAPISEGEAETIAWYFFEKPKNAKPLKKGVNFPYLVKQGDKVAHGAVTINRQCGCFYDFFGKNLEIGGVKKYYRGVRIINLSQDGIINMWIRKEGEKYIGKWGYDKPLYEISIDSLH